MSNNIYWTVSMEAVLDEAGVAVTPDQLHAIAKGAADAAAMESEATGACYIPHPLEAEVSALKHRVKEARAETEKQRDDFVKNICMRHRCEPHQVHLEGNGEATIMY
jgi:hypothetical protein